MMQKGMVFQNTRAPAPHPHASLKMAAKVVGVCVFVGLVLGYCHTLIATCMSGVR